MVFQLTGLSGAGKTTLAYRVGQLLQSAGKTVVVLDGDEMRKQLSADLGFSRQDRLTHIQRIGRLVTSVSAQIVIIAAINPYREGRSYLESYCNAKLVWIKCSLDVLKERDTKGLYRRAQLPDNHPDKLNNLTGVNDPFDFPHHADYIIHTDTESPESSALKLYGFIVAYTG